MPKNTESLRREEGESWRWSIEHEHEGHTYELRLSISEPYLGTASIVIFQYESVGQGVRSFDLDMNQLEDLERGIAEARRIASGDATPEELEGQS